MRTQRTHEPLTHITYKTQRQTKYTPSGSGLPQQGAWWHNPNCYGTTPGVWQRAQGVDLASESPRSWSDRAAVGCAGQSPIWGGSILQSCRTHRIPPSKDALHGLILWVLQLARSDTPRLVLEHPMDGIWPGGYLEHFFSVLSCKEPTASEECHEGVVFGWMVHVKKHWYECQDLLSLMFRLTGVDSIFITINFSL